MNSVKINYIYNTVFQVVMMVVPIITTPYLSRVIGAEGIGTYSYHYALTSYFTLFIKLGMDNYGNREIAAHRNNRLELNKVFSELVYLQLFMGIIVSISYILYTIFISSEIKYSLLFSSLIVATCLDINWALYGMEEFKTVSLRNAAVKTISTILIFTMIKNENDIFYYCLVLNMCTLISQLISWPLVGTKISLTKVSRRDVLKHVKPNMILFMSLISVSLFKTMDKVMLGVMTPDKLEVGYYEASERIIHIPNLLVTSLGTVMMPRITNMIASNNAECNKHLTISMVFSMAVACSLSFGIMGVSKEFVPMFYGPGFEKCIILYMILLPCCIFMSFATVIRTQYILPNHRDKAILIASVLGALLNLSINFILIPLWGSIGAAIATLASEIVACIYQAVAVRKEIALKKYIKYACIFTSLGGVMYFAIGFNITFTSNVVAQIVCKFFFSEVIFFIGLIGVLFLARDKDNGLAIAYTEIMNVICRVAKIVRQK